jgi:hypothetical protein
MHSFLLTCLYLRAIPYFSFTGSHFISHRVFHVLGSPTVGDASGQSHFCVHFTVGTRTGWFSRFPSAAAPVGNVTATASSTRRKRLRIPVTVHSNLGTR